jgi:hypothetical protein
MNCSAKNIAEKDGPRRSTQPVQNAKKSCLGQILLLHSVKKPKRNCVKEISDDDRQTEGYDSDAQIFSVRM